jgi:PAS domain S-box-containing protein
MEGTERIVDDQEHPTSPTKNPDDSSDRTVPNSSLNGGEEPLYRTLFELLPSSVILLDLNGSIRDVNPAFCRWMGFSREELVGVHVTRFSGDPPETIEQNLVRLRKGELLEHEVVNRQKDGSLRHYEIRERAVDLPDGTRGILIVSNDITDRKTAEAERLDLERQRLHAQKLESLGVLAGGIAHDFNNLFTVVIGHLDLASVLVPTTSPAQDSLREISDATRRAAELTRLMLAYSGRGRFVTQPVNLGNLVTETLRQLQPSLAHDVCVDLRIRPDLPDFPADSSQLAQVLKSLLINAAEAIPDSGGTIRVSVGEGEFDAFSLSGNRTDQPVTPGRFMVLEIADDGIGMPDDVRQRMFDPFFSTKFAGRGLSMAATLGIVRAHNGALFVDSAPRHGTTVRVLLPAPTLPPVSVLQDGPLAQKQSARPAGPFTGTILLAEDEDGIRMLVEKLLRDVGLKVVSASTGELAIELFAQRSTAISFAVLDLTLPGISGIETLARLRQTRPDLKAILTSGYQRETIKGCQDEAGFIDFIQKPYDIATFRKVIASVCEKLKLAPESPDSSSQV